MSEERRSGGGGFTVKQVLIAVLAVVVLVLAVVNFESTRIDLVFVDVTMPLFFVIVGSAVVGWLVGIVMGNRKKRDPKD